MFFGSSSNYNPSLPLTYSTNSTNLKRALEKMRDDTLSCSHAEKDMVLDCWELCLDNE